MSEASKATCNYSVYTVYQLHDLWFPCMVWISLVPRPETRAARSGYSDVLYCYTPCIARLASFPGPYHFPNLRATEMAQAWETGTTSCGPLPPTQGKLPGNKGLDGHRHRQNYSVMAPYACRFESVVGTLEDGLMHSFFAIVA